MIDSPFRGVGPFQHHGIDPISPPIASVVPPLESYSLAASGKALVSHSQPSSHGDNLPPKSIHDPVWSTRSPPVLANRPISDPNRFYIMQTTCGATREVLGDKEMLASSHGHRLKKCTRWSDWLKWPDGWLESRFRRYWMILSMMHKLQFDRS